MSLLNFKVSGTSESPTRLNTQARNFKLTIDEPESLGGKDEGANPVEYILAGYAGCLNVVIHLVAKEKGITIHQLKLDVDGDVNPEKLLGLSQQDRAGFKNIHVAIEVDSNATESQLEELIKEAKGRCPVNDTLSNPTPVSYSVIQKTVIN